MKELSKMPLDSPLSKRSESPLEDQPFQMVIENLMQEIVHSGSYESACLFNAEGLPLSQYAGQQSLSELRSVRISMMMHEVQKAIKNIGGLRQVKEIMVEDTDGKKIVFRFISFFGQTVILVVVVPAHKSYRGLTNRLTNTIAKLGGKSEGKAEEG